MTNESERETRTLPPQTEDAARAYLAKFNGGQKVIVGDDGMVFVGTDVCVEAILSLTAGTPPAPVTATTGLRAAALGVIPILDRIEGMGEGGTAAFTGPVEILRNALKDLGGLGTAPAPVTVTLTDIHIAIWDALCPGMIPSAEDLVHYGQAADAVMALLQRKSPATSYSSPGGTP